jgi:AcrR family transcriptional regulator
VSLRDRKKQHSREVLAATALRLFTELGFDAVTVDQIAEQAQLSPRTFFRYFGSKEAVLFADQDEILELLCNKIDERPADEAPLAVLRHTLVALADHYTAHRDRHLQRARLARTEAQIASYRRTVLLPKWETTLTDTLAAHMAVDPAIDLRPRLLAAVAVAVMSSIGPAWLADGDQADAAQLLDQAFDALETAVLESLRSA